MTEAEIKEAIDKLSEAAEERLKNADPLWSRLNPTPFDWMTPQERTELHRLKLMLPSFGEQREAAKKRIKERIANRERQ